ncbi:MAG: glycerol-3-phosphate acyltransferase, partial [Actinomycetota bacterium]
EPRRPGHVHERVRGAEVLRRGVVVGARGVLLELEVARVARALGTSWGVLVFLLDGLKGAVPAAAGVALDTRPGAYLLVGAAVLGHMFPVTRRFRGGKGVATMGGAVAVLHPLVFAALLVVWLVVRKLSDKASLASIAIAIGLPLGIVIERSPGWEVLASGALALLVMLRHTDNIRRLASRTELRA